MKEIKVINILGTDYLVAPGLKDAESDGDVNFYNKTINVRDQKDLFGGDGTDQEKRKRMKEVFRHEITHAMLFESGFEEFAYNEELVNWFAIQSPKLFKLFQKLDVL